MINDYMVTMNFFGGGGGEMVLVHVLLTLHHIMALPMTELRKDYPTSYNNRATFLKKITTFQVLFKRYKFTTFII